MSPTSEFWGLIVQVLIAVGTIGAVFVALFGGWLRGHLVPPKLVLKLKNTHGSETPVIVTGPGGITSETKGRWYHVRVSNKRRWSPCTQVQVFLLRVEEPDAASEFKMKWVGEIPIRWRNQEIKPLVQTIGRADDGDLCSVVKEGGLSLQPLFRSFALDAKRDAACQLIVTLQARGVEADSNLLRVKISWDGEWSDDAGEMAHHMVVEEVH